MVSEDPGVAKTRIHSPSSATASGSLAPQVSPDEVHQVVDVLTAEYGVLMSALNAAWSASLTRTSVFLGVLSAAGVAFGFAAQGGMELATYLVLALAVFLIVLFLGVATFIRLVQVQRESMIYLTGMNRIRYFFQQSAPASRPYLVLPVYDDAPALYRSIGTGMTRTPPKFQLLHLTVQTQGIVGIVTSVVAAACAGIATYALGTVAAWVIAALMFLVTITALFVYWQRSLAELRGAIRPLNPTPSEKLDAPF